MIIGTIILVSIYLLFKFIFWVIDKLENEPKESTMTEEKMTEEKILEDQIIMVIKTVEDPEIPVNIYELGLIYFCKY